MQFNKIKKVMTKGDKIKEVENSIKMYEKDIEDCGNKISKELLEKELEEKQGMLKELQSLTDEEFENIMKLLDSYTEKNGVSFGFASYLVGDKIG